MLFAVAACTGANPNFGVRAIDDAAATADGAIEAPLDAAARDAPEDLPAGPPEDAAAGEPVEVDGGGGSADGSLDAVTDAVTEVEGLRGDYFVGRNFEALAFSRIDLLVNFAWVHAAPDPRLPVDDFSVRWTGEISPRHSEVYTFHADHDDGVRLWIAGTAVINRWGSTGQDTQGQIALTAGQRYPIRLEHFDLGLTATMRLSWSSATQSKEPIPTARLHTPRLTLTPCRRAGRSGRPPVSPAGRTSPPPSPADGRGRTIFSGGARTCSAGDGCGRTFAARSGRASELVRPSRSGGSAQEIVRPLPSAGEGGGEVRPPGSRPVLGVLFCSLIPL